MAVAAEFHLDPKVFIRKCGLEALGTLMFGHNILTRRCRECWHTESERLPRLRKRLIYVDQFAYSNMAKAIDPLWAAKRGSQDSFWTEMFDALDRAMKLQLIVCPYSTVHEKESSVSTQPPVAYAARRARRTGCRLAGTRNRKTPIASGCRARPR